jgi:hypothetical protein
MGAPAHRGAGDDLSRFAMKLVRSRLDGFQKDIRICLTPAKSKGGSGITHAYFPALGACCATLEYLAGLHLGSLRRLGWQQVADWAAHYLPQPAYDRETVRILFEAFRHPVAHRGIASGVWVDRHAAAGSGRRLTWKVSADSRRPACELLPEAGRLVRDPPWPCSYTHRVHIHLKGLEVDIRRGAARYSRALVADPQLLANFTACMRQLYPQ